MSWFSRSEEVSGVVESVDLVEVAPIGSENKSPPARYKIVMLRKEDDSRMLAYDAKDEFRLQQGERVKIVFAKSNEAIWLENIGGEYLGRWGGPIPAHAYRSIKACTRL